MVEVSDTWDEDGELMICLGGQVYLSREQIEELSAKLIKALEQ